MKPQFLESIFDSGTAIRLSEISVLIPKLKHFRHNTFKTKFNIVLLNVKINQFLFFHYPLIAQMLGKNSARLRGQKLSQKNNENIFLVLILI